LFGYYAEEHVVQTTDGYLLGIHRLPYKRGEEHEGVLVNARPSSGKKPVVYLHHGLLMNSEVWVCITEEERCLPFALVERGYDVWLGNNRGNKYSKKSTRFSPASTDFWNFSMDQFAFHDIPDSIDYILGTTSQPSLSYIGFSQGTAQAFATLSIHPPLNEKINLFIALAPAMSPAGLSNGIVDSLVKASPDLLFLAFGRKSILSSATFWQSILYPPIFVRVIDTSLAFLFAWYGRNISPHQKLAAYPHLYSFTSTKSVVHWFQIIRNKSFQMYDDDASLVFSIGASDRHYKVAKFPTRNIKIPIVLVYGGSDSLVDIKAMLRELPKHTMAFEVKHYEHLDFLWAQGVDKLVFPHVFNALRYYSHSDENNGALAKAPGLSFADADTARLRARSGSVSEDDRSPSDFDGAWDTPMPIEKRKSAAQVARERHYLPATADLPITPDSPVQSWNLSRPVTRRLAEPNGNSNSNTNNDGKGASIAKTQEPNISTPSTPPPPPSPHPQNQPPNPPTPDQPLSSSDSETRKPTDTDIRPRKRTRDQAPSPSSQSPAASTTPGNGVSAPRFGNHGIRLGTSRPSISVAAPALTGAKELDGDGNENVVGEGGERKVE
jgi:lysosomal acid lipase/cholesteryl ester hydrolase